MKAFVQAFWQALKELFGEAKINLPPFAAAEVMIVLFDQAGQEIKTLTARLLPHVSSTSGNLSLAGAIAGNEGDYALSNRNLYLSVKHSGYKPDTMLPQAGKYNAFVSQAADIAQAEILRQAAHRSGAVAMALGMLQDLRFSDNDICRFANIASAELADIKTSQAGIKAIATGKQAASKADAR